MSPRMHRRTFLKTTTAAAAGLAASQMLPAAVSEAPPAPLPVLPYRDVELLAGPMKEQFDYHHQLFLNLEEDRMVKVFRQQAKMPAPGENMGGWYDLDGFDLEHNNWTGFVPGHSFGQYVSGLARAYAVTGSEPTRSKGLRLVKGYAATLDARPSFLDGYRLPGYTYDKLACGLMDAHEFARDPIAMAAHQKLTRDAMMHLPEKALSRPEQRARPHKHESFTWDETYTLPENLFLAYQRSRKPYYRDLAVRFLEDDTYFNPLAANIPVLADEHAYSHVNAFSSAMQAYLTLGSRKHLRAAQNGFNMVLAQSFATGGWGPSERLLPPGKGELGDSLEQTHSSFETPCGAYGHFKIARYLLRVTRDARYADSMERVLYNTILGAKPILPDGSTFYYSDFANNGKKTYFRDKWPCCSGTFPQLVADYHQSVYLGAPNGLYVNLFVPSRVRFTAGGAKVTLTQDTSYPANGRIAMRVALSRPADFTVHVRIPQWAGEGAVLSANGKRVAAVKPGYVPVQRSWSDGDRIELELPLPQRLEAVDEQHPNLVALVRGPLVLNAVGEGRPVFERAALLRAEASASGWEATAAAADGKQLTLRAFMKIGDETYNTYMQAKA